MSKQIQCIFDIFIHWHDLKDLAISNIFKSRLVLKRDAGELSGWKYFAPFKSTTVVPGLKKELFYQL